MLYDVMSTDINKYI